MNGCHQSNSLCLLNLGDAGINRDRLDTGFKFGAEILQRTLQRLHRTRCVGAEGFANPQIFGQLGQRLNVFFFALLLL